MNSPKKTPTLSKSVGFANFATETDRVSGRVQTRDGTGTSQGAPVSLLTPVPTRHTQKENVMRKASHIVFSLLLVVASLTFETGCGKVPKLTPVQLVQLISSQVPADLIVAGSISSLAGNPDLAAVFTKIGNAASQDLPLIKTAADTWLANQTSGNFAALAERSEEQRI